MLTKGQDMVDCMALLKPDAMVGHWEFTLGAERVKAITEKLGFPFLAQNIRDTEWNEPAFEPMTMIERGGVKIAVIGQAFPYTPIANPRWMMPNWSFGIREEDLQAQRRRRRARAAPSSWCCCRTTASTSTASSPRASRASTSSSPGTPTTRCPTWSRSARRCWSHRAATASSCRGSISTCAAAR